MDGERERDGVEGAELIEREGLRSDSVEKEDVDDERR